MKYVTRNELRAELAKFKMEIKDSIDDVRSEIKDFRVEMHQGFATMNDTISEVYKNQTRLLFMFVGITAAITGVTLAIARLIF